VAVDHQPLGGCRPRWPAVEGKGKPEHQPQAERREPD